MKSNMKAAEDQNWMNNVMYRNKNKIDSFGKNMSTWTMKTKSCVTELLQNVLLSIGEHILCDILLFPISEYHKN